MDTTDKPQDHFPDPGPAGWGVFGTEANIPFALEFARRMREEPQQFRFRVDIPEGPVKKTG